MLAVLALLLSPVATDARQAVRRPSAAPVAAQAVPDVKATLRRRLGSLEDRNHGVFHEDVTADVAPLFPSGQSFADTQRTLGTQGLGELRRFKGEPHDGTTMYVARFPLAPDMSDSVYVVIDFDFDGRTEADMRLTRVKAFLRASNM